MIDKQISLTDIYPVHPRFTSKRCAATQELCSHKPGTCAESCCQRCNTPCHARCDYSVAQAEVKVDGVWVVNPDYWGNLIFPRELEEGAQYDTNRITAGAGRTD